MATAFNLLRKGESDSYLKQLIDLDHVAVDLPDKSKAFDVINLLRLLNEFKIDKDAKIIALGAFNDASLWVLRRLGFKNLYGIDLNSKIYDSKYYTEIKYMYGDIENTHFPDSFFDVCVCLSVIEHVNATDKVIEEARRILKEDGLFVVTTDYYPSKKITGLEVSVERGLGNPSTKMGKHWGWKIFSSDEITELIETSIRHDLTPLFDTSDISASSGEDLEAVEYKNIQYTFIFLRFRKKSGAALKGTHKPAFVELLVPSYKGLQGGISTYSKVLARRLEKDYGIKSVVIFNEKESRADTIIIEYEPGLPRAKDIINIVNYLSSLGKNVFLDCHSRMKLSAEEVSKLESLASLIYRTNELAYMDGAKQYTICPHISFDYLVPPTPPQEGVTLGHFGYWEPRKRVDQIVTMAQRLDLKAKILLTYNTEVGSEEAMKKFENDIKSLRHRAGDRIEINLVKSGDHTTIIDQLSEATHFVFSHMTAYEGQSGTMTFCKIFHKPIISTDNFQSKISSVYRVPYFNSPLEYLKNVIFDLKSKMSNGLNLPKSPGYYLNIIVILVKSKKVGPSFFPNIRGETRNDDGLEYLVSILQCAK
jgi:SAM-dependent methyltransferase